METPTGALTGQAGEGPQVDPRAFDVGAQPAQTPVQPAPGPAARPVSSLPAPAAPAVSSPTEEHHNFIGRMFHGALSTLGGGDQTSMARDDKGNMVVTRTPGTPGTWARNIIAGALTGMAAGAAAPRGSGPLGAIGMGAEARIGQVQNQEQQKRQQADQDFATKQKAAIDSAQTALLTQENAASTWNLQDKKVDSAFKLDESEAQFASRVASNSQNRDLGVYPDLGALIGAHKEIAPDLIKAHVNGTLVMHPAVDANHNVVGTHFAILNPDWMDKPTTADTRIQLFKPPEKPGDKPTITEQIIPAGATTEGNAFKLQMGTQAPMLQWSNQQETQRMEQERLDKVGEVTAADRYREAQENHRAEVAASAKENNPSQSEAPVIGFDKSGNQIFTSEGDAKQQGLKAVRKVGQAEAEKVTNARGLLPLLSNQDPSDPGLLQMADALDKKHKLGSIASRWNDFLVGKVGSGDPDYAAFRAKMGLATTALMQVHVGSRGGAFMLEHFQDLADGGKMNANTLKSALNVEHKYITTKAMLPRRTEQSEAPVQRPAGAKSEVMDGPRVVGWRMPDGNVQYIPGYTPPQ